MTSEEFVDGAQRMVVLPFRLAVRDVPHPGLRPIMGHDIAARRHQRAVQLQLLKHVRLGVIAVQHHQHRPGGADRLAHRSQRIGGDGRAPYQFDAVLKRVGLDGGPIVGTDLDVHADLALADQFEDGGVKHQRAAVSQWYMET